MFKEKCHRFFEKNDIEIQFDSAVDCKYIFSKRFLCLKIIKYRKIKKISVLYSILEKNKKFKSGTPLEKYILLYGKKYGIIKFNQKKKGGVTLEKMIQKCGEKEGRKRFDEWRKKQAYSNTFEYKNKKYGMTKDEFKKYNYSRAVTIENQIKKYGEKEGRKRFQEYCQKQAYTNSEEYFGTERYIKVNKLKGHTLSSYIERYKNEETAKKKMEEYLSSVKNYSLKSQRLFWYIHDNILNKEEKEHTYFVEKNKEYVVTENNGKVYLYDFVCSKLKLCIEFHGDHYHGNPSLYSPSQKLKGRGQTKTSASKRWKEDDIKKQSLEKNRNYDCLVVWEKDYNENKDLVINKIEKAVYEKRINV